MNIVALEHRPLEESILVYEIQATHDSERTPALNSIGKQMRSRIRTLKADRFVDSAIYSMIAPSIYDSYPLMKRTINLLRVYD